MNTLIKSYMRWLTLSINSNRNIRLVSLNSIAFFTPISKSSKNNYSSIWLDSKWEAKWMHKRVGRLEWQWKMKNRVNKPIIPFFQRNSCLRTAMNSISHIPIATEWWKRIRNKKKMIRKSIYLRFRKIMINSKRTLTLISVTRHLRI